MRTIADGGRDREDHRHAARRQAAGARRRARPAPTPPRRSGPAWPRRRWRSGSTASCATSRRRCPTAAEIAILTDRDPEALELIRHDAAHVMAEAVLELYPGTKVTIGPPIETGFYYDFEFPDGVKDHRGRPARRSRRRCARTSTPTRRSSAATSPVAEAIELFRGQGQDYKVELIEDLVRDEGVETVSLYRNGPFEDLCRGPHGPSTGRIKAIKLNSVAGAYWRGDENRQMLTRIYGTAFFSKKDLERAPGADRAGQGARPPPPRPPARPLHAARGGARDAVLAAQRDDAAAPDRGRGARRSCASAATRRSRRRRCSTRSSGTAPGTGTTTATTCTSCEADERRFALRPMNCPGACLVFASERHSYRELPLRLAEFGRVSRNEREGVLHGLLRVRAFTQDDAHVYCTEEQIADEVADDLRGDRRALRALRLRRRAGRALDPAGEVDGHRGAVGEGRGGAARGARAPGPRVRAQPRRRRLLRAEDRLPRHRRARPLLAVRHLPARLPDARALRPLLHRRRRRRRTGR